MYGFMEIIAFACRNTVLVFTIQSKLQLIPSIASFANRRFLVDTKFPWVLLSLMAQICWTNIIVFVSRNAMKIRAQLKMLSKRLYPGFL